MQRIVKVARAELHLYTLSYQYHRYNSEVYGKRQLIINC